MADQEESFGENPFRRLKVGDFPQRKDAARAEVNMRSTHMRRRPAGPADASAAAPAASPEDARDAELFLRAMSRVHPTRRSRKPEGFTLTERQALPGSAGAKTQERARQSASAADRAPAAATPCGAGLALPRSGSAMVGEAQPAARPGQGAAADDEAAAVRQAVREATPLVGKGRAVAPAPAPGTPPAQGELSLQDFMDGKLEFALSFTDEYLEGYVVGLDPLILNKLRAGSLSPEAHMDLHGLTVEQAFEALRGFLRGSWYKGLRTVLVVPGRGRKSPDGQGVLRGKLQTWLTQEPFKRVVLAFCTAQPHDGGPGSVYVLLRKYRKKGRVYWERLPADADLYRDF